MSDKKSTTEQNAEKESPLILTNLKIISSLKPGDKLTSKDNILVIDTSYVTQGAYRWINGDSRSSSVEFIKKVMDKAYNIIDNIYMAEFEKDAEIPGKKNYYSKREVNTTYFKDGNSQQLQAYSIELTNAIKGLQNLKVTYKDDIATCSKIDVVVDKISIRIKKINNLLTINQGGDRTN